MTKCNTHVLRTRCDRSQKRTKRNYGTYAEDVLELVVKTGMFDQPSERRRRHRQQHVYIRRHPRPLHNPPL